MTKMLLPGARIGIIGAGQLGKMLAQSAQKMGYKVSLYDPNPNSCGFAVANDYVVADFSDREALLDFVQSVDVVTYEFENIDGPLLKEVDQVAYLPQGSQLLLTSQDRVAEKTWLNQIGCQTVDFVVIEEAGDLEVAGNQLGYPMVVKTTRMGYDGKGQFLVKSAEDLAAVRQDGGYPYIAEAFFPYEYEASIIVARNPQGDMTHFPLSINQHLQGVLYSSLVQDKLPDEVQQQIREMAYRIAQAGQLVGVCGVEFFVSEEGRAVVNELAPRPHNSGHYTMEACDFSQFDLHILGVTGRPLPIPKLLAPALMINILGQHVEKVGDLISHFPDAMIHLYDKGEAKAQRKMGHFTLLEEADQDLNQVRDQDDFLVNWAQQFDA